MPNVNDEYEVIGWGETIKRDPKTFPELTEGDYDFTIIDVTRGEHDGTGAIPVVCPKFQINLQVSNGEISGRVRDNFYFVKKWKWKIDQLLESVGLFQTDEDGFNTDNIMNLIGMTGRCKLSKSGKFTNVNRYYRQAATDTQGFTQSTAQSPFQGSLFK